VPTYVYKFLETGETIEVQQSFDDQTLTEATHPVTGITMAVKKVFLPVGVTFKGDGFYKTDSRTTAKSSSGSASSADPAGSSAPDSATTTSSASPAAGPASSSTSSSD
jgi:predicted nucleic acid-binding Zn ribbon protein